MRIKRRRTQRTNMRAELWNDNYFQETAPFFELGIFFSGSLNRDDFNRGNESLYEQFLTISDYRTKLIELFTSDIKPFPISEMLISDIRRLREQAEQQVRITEGSSSLGQNTCVSTTDEQARTTDQAPTFG